MKSIVSQIKALPSAIFAVLAIGLALVISGALIYLLALPSFQNLGTLSDEIAAEKIKAAAIDTSITNLRTQDKDVLDSLEKFLATYVPGAVDNLHFATLNEAVSQASGVTVSNIQITQSAAKTAAPAANSSSSGQKPTTQAQTNQNAGVTVAVTYTSNFDSLLQLLKYWKLADQLVGVKSLDIKGVSGTTLNYTINYDLPTSPAVAKAVVEDNLVFSKTAAQELLDLNNSVIFTATPSAQSVGKSNPFN